MALEDAADGGSVAQRHRHRRGRTARDDCRRQREGPDDTAGHDAVEALLLASIQSD